MVSVVLCFVPAESGSCSADSGEVLLEEGNRYLELIGSLLYLANTTRPDIANAVGILSRYRGAPTTSHMRGGKRVLAYLKGASDVSLVYGTEVQDLHAYVDADYAGCLDGRRSTSGSSSSMEDPLVSWGSKKEQSVASSTVESEYMAFHAVVKEAKWLRLLMIEFGQGDNSVIVFCNNAGCIANFKKTPLHRRTSNTLMLPTICQGNKCLQDVLSLSMCHPLRT
jgi:hypothetical protein